VLQNLISFIQLRGVSKFFLSSLFGNQRKYLFMCLDVMLNEPEYEDEPINRSSFGDSKSSFRMLGNQNGSPEKVICNKMKTHSCLNNLETQASKVLLNDFVHSTPIRYFSI
jgi:ABC-type enterochelin transport system ATPase subunit